MVFSKIASSSQEFLFSLKENKDIEEKSIFSFISQSESLEANVPEFDTELEWFNTSAALSFQGNLKGKLVVLDFFTYCCINCMHVLPDLHALEQIHSIESGVVVVGVHSAKFENEKVSSNVLSAILRYGITHAVVNDNDAVLWNKMEIQCWPTFVVVSPEGKCILYLVGEGNRDALLRFVKTCVKYYGETGKLANHSLPLKLAKESALKTTLSFPGKICLAGDELAISDTGNNKIILVSKDGMVNKTFGGAKPGWKDGSSNNASFNAPQGIKYSSGALFVADTDNHVIRKIDLNDDVVYTITGSGTQGNDKEGGNMGLNQEISSPWGITMGPSPGKDGGENVLYIAMAGTHQIWSVFLKDGGWLKGGTQKAGTCLRFAGSGNEENRNNSYPHKASFAQPSGITLATVNNKQYLYIADSESSSIRSIELTNGAVKACVGGERDPMNLFAFGDEDGKGIDAKLQHPLAVVWNSCDGMIYLADSYNHKIKIINPSKCTCETLTGTGKPGFQDGTFSEAQFNEPGGLEISHNGKQLYVADTNNHCIRVIDLEKKNVTKLAIFSADELDAVSITSTSKQQKTAAKKRLAPKNAPVYQLELLPVNLDNSIEFEISIRLPDDCHYTEEAQSRFMITLENEDETDVVEIQKGSVSADGMIRTIVSFGKASEEFITFQVDILVYFCSPSGVCLMKSLVLKQPLQHDEQIKENFTIKHLQAICL